MYSSTRDKIGTSIWKFKDTSLIKNDELITKESKTDNKQ